MKLRSLGLLGVAASLALLSPHRPAPAAQGTAAERGAFTLHKFMQPIGRETYEVAREGEDLVLGSDFLFTDRGTPVPMKATLRAAADYTPRRFELKGKNSRSTGVDILVEAGARARVTRDGVTREEAVSGPFVTTGGYGPVAVQMAMMRYWLAHGRPARMRALPAGEVAIADRGPDVFDVGGRKVALRRYSVDGLLWGREWLWLNERQGLAAVVTFDAEFDHFEAVREGLEPALGELVRRAAADGMAQLAEISKGAGRPGGGDLAVVGGTLIDGTGRAPVPDSVVVVRGGRVAAAGPRSAVKVPAGAEVVDARGGWVIPGLWDMHAHYEQVEWGPVYLAAGVTTVRDCGNELEFIAAARDAIDAGRGLGPRLLLAGLVDGDSPGALGVVRVNTPADVAPVVARYKAAGFRQIKIYQSLKPELVPLVVAEAHKAGMTVTGHVPSGMDALQAVAAGMDQINHLHFVAVPALGLDRMQTMPLAEAAAAIGAVDLDGPEAQRVIRTLAEHHTVVDPTIALREWLWHPASVPFETLEPGAAKLPAPLAAALAQSGAPEDRAAHLAVIFDKLLALIRALHRAGVPIVAGTDQTIPGHSLHREIELYVRAGLTPMEALQAATLVPARVMGLERESGTVEAGKAADLVVLDGDPLADIANTRKIRTVVARGRAFDPAALWRAAGFRP